jgi:hypothetical protein
VGEVQVVVVVFVVLFAAYQQPCKYTVVDTWVDETVPIRHSRSLCETGSRADAEAVTAEFRRKVGRGVPGGGSEVSKTDGRKVGLRNLGHDGV